MKQEIILTAVVVFMILTGCKEEDSESEVLRVLPSNQVNDLYLDNQNTLWIATSNGLASYRQGVWKTYDSTSSLEGKNIASLAYQFSDYSGDELWLATNNGLGVFSYEIDAVSSATNYTSENSELLNNMVSAVAVDTGSARWIGTSEGLIVYQGSDWFEPSTNHKFSGYTITDIETDENGWCFVSTSGRGVLTFRMDVDVVSGATFVSDWSPLETDMVHSVFVASDSVHYYATDSGAVFHEGYNRTDLKYWKKYRKKDGLISDKVFAIVLDNEGILWFGTDLGLSSFDGSAWQSYTASDGLVHNQVNCLEVDIDNTLWIGTPGGLSSMQNGILTSYLQK
ncbi:MAG: hypothetical protein IPM71_04175 [Bacteroidota bacterium]|nr:MAG: hypothetical protein IPM71_04175 [Bacteroidota bacterium]